MSELKIVIAETYQTIQRLSALADETEFMAAHPLLADLEFHVARIETEAAHLNQENIELQRHIFSLQKVEMPTPERISPRPVQQRPDARHMMQEVSKFYQLFCRETQYRKAG